MVRYDEEHARMITFCLNQHATLRGFDPAVRPRLTFVCKAEGKDEAIPRVMHKHDDRFELMFIRAGSGTYNIDGRGYQVKQGDIILFNAHVLHDENPAASDERPDLAGATGSYAQW